MTVSRFDVSRRTKCVGCGKLAAASAATSAPHPHGYCEPCVEQIACAIWESPSGHDSVEDRAEVEELAAEALELLERFASLLEALLTLELSWQPSRPPTANGTRCSKSDDRESRRPVSRRRTHRVPRAVPPTER